MRLNYITPFILTISISLFIIKVEPAFSENVSDNIRTITVIGQGESNIEPDMAILNLTVLRQAKTAKEANNEVKEATSSVLRMLEYQGIDRRDIKSTTFSISPQYNNNGKIIKYNVTHTLKVSLRNIDIIGEVVDRAISLGINSSDEIIFTNQNTTDIINDTRKKAIANAITQAKVLTQAAGIKLGKVRKMNEITDSARPFVMQKLSSNLMPVQLSSGEATYRIKIKIIFDIE